MQCTNCLKTKSSRWRGEICNSCYQNNYRVKNIIRLRKYSSSLEVRFRHSQRVAKRRKINWDLSFEIYIDICNKPCFYCNNKVGEPVVNGLGLDRIDNSLGYTKDNILPCCGICNNIRGETLSVLETQEVIKLICKMRNI